MGMKKSSWAFWFRHRQLIDSGLCALLAVVGWWVQGDHPQGSLVLFVMSYFFGGYQAVWNGARSLRERKIDVDLLMIVAALGAASVGYWEDGATLLFLFSLSNALQEYALQRTHQAIGKLMDFRPDRARVLQDGEEIVVSLEEVHLGDRVLVMPGERIPLDGHVVHGESYVDQSPITGESVPVHKSIHDSVFAGTMNQGGFLEIVVTKRSDETTLARIIRLVEEAQGQKARTQHFLERFEQFYTVAILAATAAAVAFPVLWGVPFDRAFYRAMTLLVVASPCALVMGTPAALLSSIANLARRGVLMKGAIYLEVLASIKAIAFDKTGTLTVGRPEVTDLIADDGREDELLLWAASLEQRAEHHLAKAIFAKAAERNLSLMPVEAMQTLPGKGVAGKVRDATVLVGNRRYLEEQGIRVDERWLRRASELEAEGKSMVFVVRNQKMLGIIGLQDRPRSMAAKAVADIHQMGIEHTAILSGDLPVVARAVAAQVGIGHAYGGLLPEEKVAKIRELQQQYGTIAMVGDGVNDAPALASASVGIAMGAAGTDVALETADVVLMGDDLELLPYALERSKLTRKIVMQNIFFALGVIVVLVTFTLAGRVTLPLAVIGHEGSTIVVIANALRLLAGGKELGVSARKLKRQEEDEKNKERRQYAAS